MKSASQNVSLVYSTMTGHSARLAKAISDKLSIPMANVKDNPQLQNVDLLFVVSALYGAKSSPELIAFVQNLDAGNVKHAAIVSNSLSLGKPEELRQALTDKGIDVVDEFVCMGSLFFILGAGHPNKKDLTNAAAFAESVLDRLKTRP